MLFTTIKIYKKTEHTVTLKTFSKMKMHTVLILIVSTLAKFITTHIPPQSH